MLGWGVSKSNRSVYGSEIYSGYAKILKEFGVSIEGTSPVIILFKKDSEPETKPEIEPTPEPTPELEPEHKPGEDSKEVTGIEPEKLLVQKQVESMKFIPQ